MDSISSIDNAWMLMDNISGKIISLGKMDEIPNHQAEIIDMENRAIMPTWVDSHTHLVFAKSREQEFVDRINGLSYQEIASRGGGILNSVEHTRQMSEDELFEKSLVRLNNIISLGTGAVEIKSGYGLNLESELKLLKVINRLKDISPIPIKSTFLGAHAIPKEFKDDKKGYIHLIINEILPEVAKNNYADFCDIFCEKDYFDFDDVINIMTEAKRYGIIPKVHAEQLSHSNGIEAGVKVGAISVDHVEFANLSDFEFLKNSSTIPNILPGAAYFLGLPNPPVRNMIDYGLGISIASDFNPGSSPTSNMHLMTSIACVQYKITPNEAINAATINSAYAMNVSNIVGSISENKFANFIVLKDVQNLNSIPYSIGMNIIDEVWINGKPFKNNKL
jgi:imidazolonepropionase